LRSQKTPQKCSDILVRDSHDGGPAPAKDDVITVADDEMERLKEESSLLKTHFFSTKIEVPEDFLPTVVGGLTGKFKLHTITKMVREVKAAKGARAAIKRRRKFPLISSFVPLIRLRRGKVLKCVTSST
jgi:hypothetical protein